uniref:Transmembrane channel-like protein n=2 Tax=Erpetoichthys calabaricus TaxID=27687 RepID=A0A8C4SQP3_ERPCA
MEPGSDVFQWGHGPPLLSNPLLDQLPSYQSLRYRRRLSSGSSRRKRSVSRQRMGSSSSGRWAGPDTDDLLKTISPQRPVKELPISMSDKRRVWEHHKEQHRDLSSLHQWWLGRQRSFRRFKDDSHELLSALVLWRKDIHVIEGKFGTGIQSYFSFLRFLVVLNLVMFLMLFCFVTLPVIISDYEVANSTMLNVTASFNCTIYPSTVRQGLVLFHQYIIDALSGTGFLEQTYLFYGYYRMDSVHFPTIQYRMPLAYLLTSIACLLLSLFWTVKRSVHGFKLNLIQDEDRFQSFCNKIFAGWDFCITDERAARLKHSSLHYELKTDLDEERIKQKIAHRTRKEICHIYFLRLLLNMFVIGVLGGCFYAIYRATIYSQEYSQTQPQQAQNFIVGLIVEYLPSIVITAANFITPLIFEVVIRYEDYSPAFEIRFTLIRCVFVRLASIGVLLFTLWSQITFCGGESCFCGYNNNLYPCWETRVGQEMYKLAIFDFLIIGAVAVLVEFPRNLIVTHCSCSLAKWFGQQEFSVPQNVLEIVYGQTICWIGSYYSPLIPGISTIKYFIVFYIKKVSLMQNCRPSTRPFRASSSNFFFLAVLLIGLLVACVPVGVTIGHISSSKACGPFMNYNISWDVVPSAVETLPGGARKFFYVISSEAFAVTFFVVVCLVLFYFIALARAHKLVVKQLKDQLHMEGRDKMFLIQQLYKAQKTFKQQQQLRPRTEGSELEQEGMLHPDRDYYRPPSSDVFPEDYMDYNLT